MMSGSNDEIVRNERVKRPMNAFILWSRERRRELANDDPNMHNFEISKRLGIEWNRLEAKEKKHFYDEAQKLKEEHRKNHPNYKYHPKRKPRRRFSPISQSQQYRMAYYVPVDNSNTTYPVSYHPKVPWLNKNLLTNIDATYVQDMRYYPQSHFLMNTNIATGYGFHEMTSSMTGASPIIEMICSYSPGELTKRQLLNPTSHSTNNKTKQGETEEKKKSAKPQIYFHDVRSTQAFCVGCQGGRAMFYNGTCPPTQEHLKL